MSATAFAHEHHDALLRGSARMEVAGTPEGIDAVLLCALARSSGATLAHVVRDEARMSQLIEQIGFFDPEVEVLRFPAWDCLPYDRVSPRMDVMMQRLETLFRLQEPGKSAPRILLATVNAVTQRLVPRAAIRGAGRRIRVGDTVSMEDISGFCVKNGYARVDVVAEPGEFARRGGILDIFPAAASEPLRLDFFGDTLESLRGFDAHSQRSGAEENEILLLPASEALLDEESITRFRSGYVARFGAASGEDGLYQAVSRAARFRGMEHWLPLFFDKLESLFDHLPEGAWLSFDHGCESARARRLEAIEEYHAERTRHIGETSFGA
ncbi:MAG: transcription-repair coupling factor, partial [Hyphomicrobiales bacterium]|nr:transcription-repair coupling factor [Hyphomicrobiales bacterium]